MDSEYRYVGNTPTDLDEGRPIGPGELTGPLAVDEEHPKNKQLVDEGQLLQVQSEADLKTARKQESASSTSDDAPPTGKDGGGS